LREFKQYLSDFDANDDCLGTRRMVKWRKMTPNIERSESKRLFLRPEKDHEIFIESFSSIGESAGLLSSHQDSRRYAQEEIKRLPKPTSFTNSLQIGILNSDDV
jgi:hypothetical protein